MKTYKQRIIEVKAATDKEERLTALWNYISFAIRLPNRAYQQDLLNEAVPFSMESEDPYFSKSTLTFNGFTWGTGSRKILLTHGWSSKAADFLELITALRAFDDVQIIAFDALGNGSSEGELSNLMLYVNPLQAIINHFGMPHILIGHSLGAMANTMTLNTFDTYPELMVSITPVIKLEENFTSMMNAVDISPENQQQWFEAFEQRYKLPVSHFDLNKLYVHNRATRHLVLYDEDDTLLPYAHLHQFLQSQPQIENIAFNQTGHYKILKEEAAIEAILEFIKKGAFSYKSSDL